SINRYAKYGKECGLGGGGRQGAPRRAGGHRHPRFSRRFREARRRRNRQMGQGGQVLRREAGVISRSSIIFRSANRGADCPPKESPGRAGAFKEMCMKTA